MSDIVSQIARFWSLHDPAIRTAVAGMLFLAISSGTLGCFVVLRRMSLLGDALSHAVLPGVCLGFMITWTKDPVWILAGAAASALLASWLIRMILRHSRLKPDAAMGLVLSGFFGFGTLLLTRITRLPAGDKSGLNTFLLGQASAISEQDLWFMGTLSLAIMASVFAVFKELVVTSFDEGFAAAAGLPVRGLHFLLMGLTGLAVVISIQAVGVVLVSAMLIIPAASALLCTDRMWKMVLLAVAFAGSAGVVGLNASFFDRALPTGPFVVLSLSLVFLGAYLFSPRYGVAARALRRARQARRTERENGLKSVHQVLEQDATSSVSLARLAAFRKERPGRTRRVARAIVRRGWAKEERDAIALTERGLSRARELERNYRLWELFLTSEVNLPLDHTQRDAENIEHILGPELARELELRYRERNA